MTIKNPRVNLIFHVFLCVVTLAVAQGSRTVAAQSPEPKTVADFFLLVPDRYMVYYDLRFREQLLRGERVGAVVDIPNGYISWDASDNPEGFEFVIFRKNDGSYLVAYSDGAFGDAELDEELGHSPTLFLLSYEGGGRWRDVTKAFLPWSSDKKLYYDLPRQGRVIEVWDGRGRELHTLTWENDRFRISGRAGK